MGGYGVCGAQEKQSEDEGEEEEEEEEEGKRERIGEGSQGREEDSWGQQRKEGKQEIQNWAKARHPPPHKIKTFAKKMPRTRASPEK